MNYYKIKANSEKYLRLATPFNKYCVDLRDVREKVETYDKDKSKSQ
jgi:hypothetical protein